MTVGAEDPNARTTSPSSDPQRPLNLSYVQLKTRRRTIPHRTPNDVLMPETRSGLSVAARGVRLGAIGNLVAGVSIIGRAKPARSDPLLQLFRFQFDQFQLEERIKLEAEELE